jgi:hypothetical protein
MLNGRVVRLPLSESKTQHVYVHLALHPCLTWQKTSARRLSSDKLCFLSAYDSNVVPASIVNGGLILTRSASGTIYATQPKCEQLYFDFVAQWHGFRSSAYSISS